ncbi:hypothetical protein ACUY3K_02645 [Corynebacterium uberis]|uniref:hypothetical protein n=1 Tax=Corynebacterium TaxID=1716 RepID=UPI001D0A10DA|nr:MULTISPECIES: hypothetical protein [Corynebacterium]MCZ9309875.1 hypothetical protein [Corynebacterium sp. c6VSa_13]UDL73201.1 hypothetical protein LH391_08850 [Corynebacterium uberis]UDL75922.1 hypothetical protein LH393_00540 [Corynebacterium uberis]UDL78134.1 hypothetical protein LH394_00535 [Corynebacterium uberis]UDL80417.1 hypothetical protein LH392_00965 [Corynebacterium uberis]
MTQRTPSTPQHSHDTEQPGSPDSSDYPDYYALDDTRAGRLTQAGLAAALLAVHDWAPSPRAARAWQAGILTGGVGLVAYLNATDENPDNDVHAIVERMRAEPHGDVLSPAATWGLLGGVVAGGVLAARGLARARRAAAGSLGRRGVAKPNTVLGLAVGAVVFAASEVAAQ